MGALIPAAGQGLSVYEAPDNPWAEAAASVEGGAYLKFNGNTGEYTFGADDSALEYGSQVVADLFNVSFGWICWKDSDPVEEVLVKILDGKPPLEHNLPDHGPFDSEDDGWREATALPMILLTNGDGPDADADAGLKLNFKGSSGSSVRGVRKLSGAFGKLFREHQGEFPVIELSAEQFAAKEKKYGKKYAPIFTIKGWISEDELAGIIGDVSGGDYEPEEPAAVAPATRRLAAPVRSKKPSPKRSPPRRTLRQRLLRVEPPLRKRHPALVELRLFRLRKTTCPRRNRVDVRKPVAAPLRLRLPLPNSPLATAASVASNERRSLGLVGAFLLSPDQPQFIFRRHSNGRSDPRRDRVSRFRKALPAGRDDHAGSPSPERWCPRSLPRWRSPRHHHGQLRQAGRELSPVRDELRDRRSRSWHPQHSRQRTHVALGGRQRADQGTRGSERSRPDRRFVAGLLTWWSESQWV
jgi:hypothetical protein